MGTEAFREVADAQAVLEAIVTRARKYLVAYAELLNVPQALKFKRVNDAKLHRAPLGVSVHTIEDRLRHPNPSVCDRRRDGGSQFTDKVENHRLKTTLGYIY